jgi:hypothetical protein
LQKFHVKISDMSETNTTRNTNEGEIDLLDLFHRMGMSISRLMKALGRAFMITIVFMLRRWLPLGLSIIAGAIVSMVLRSTSASFYTSDMTIKTNGATAAEVIPYLNKLHTFCNEGNTAELALALSVKHESINEINDISAYWIIDQNKDRIPDYVDYKNNHNVYDTTNIRMTDRANIRVKVKSPQELSSIREGIIRFIKKDSLFQQRNRLRIRQNNELLARLDYDIVQLDSLQKVKYFEETRNRKPENGGQMIFLQEQKTQLVYTDIYDLYARKQAIESERDLYNDIVTVLSDFSLPSRRDNGAMYYARVVIPVFFCLTLLLLIVLANRKKVEEIFKKY